MPEALEAITKSGCPYEIMEQTATCCWRAKKRVLVPEICQGRSTMTTCNRSWLRSTASPLPRTGLKSRSISRQSSAESFSPMAELFMMAAGSTAAKASPAFNSDLSLAESGRPQAPLNPIRRRLRPVPRGCTQARHSHAHLSIRSGQPQFASLANRPVVTIPARHLPRARSCRDLPVEHLELQQPASRGGSSCATGGRLDHCIPNEFL